MALTDIEKQKVRASLRAFFDASKRLSHKNPTLVQITEEAAKSAAPRFFVSLSRAIRYVSMLQRGMRLNISNPYRLAMYEELNKRYNLHIEQHPEHCGCFFPLKEIILQEAPSFYISPRTFLNLVRNGLKEDGSFV